MQIIYSHVTNRDRGNNIKQHVELYALSNFLVKKHHPNFHTTFYGDEESLKLFGNINFDHFELISNNILKNIPNELWTLGKLCSMLQVNQPFLHIDGDMLLFKPLQLENLLTKENVICFHDEKFFNHSIQNMQNKLDILPKQCGNMQSISYNCGIFGGMDFQSIQKAIHIILEFTIENSSYIIKKITEYKQNYTKVSYYFDISVLVEQVWLFQILKNFNKTIYPITKIDNWNEDYDKMMKETGYVHLLSDRKTAYHDRIKNIVNQLNIKY